MNLIERLRGIEDTDGDTMLDAIEAGLFREAADEIERQQAMHLNCTKRCHKALMDVERLEGALLVIYEMGAQSDYHLVQEMSKIAKEALSGGG